MQKMSVIYDILIKITTHIELIEYHIALICWNQPGGIWICEWIPKVIVIIVILVGVSSAFLGSALSVLVKLLFSNQLALHLLSSLILSFF